MKKESKKSKSITERNSNDKSQDINTLREITIEYFKEFKDKANKQIEQLEQIFNIDKKDLTNDPDNSLGPNKL